MPEIHLKPIEQDDESFLFQIFAASRAEEMARVPWDDSLKRAFLWSQFQAQSEQYRIKYPTGDFSVILLDTQPVGRLYLGRLEEQLRIIDLAVLPQFQRQGIAREIMAELMTESRRRHKPIRIYVESFNPALAWFLKLGFQKIDGDDVYYFLEWQSGAERHRDKP